MTRAANRRDNKAGAETIERIMAAGEALFSTIGFAETSLRQLTDAANANVAAIHYHFGSKENLFAAILDRKFSPILQRRTESLKAIESGASEDDVENVRALLHSWIDPLLEAFYSPDGSGRFLLDLELQAARSVQFGEVANWVGPYNAYQQKFGEATARFAPHLAPREARWRAEIICASVLPMLRNESGTNQGDELRDLHNPTAFRAAWVRSGLRLLCAGEK